MRLSPNKLLCLLSVALCAFLGACSSNAINKDSKTSFLTSTDLTVMTDKMAQSITADPYVQQVIAQKPMIIVMQPIANETNEIIPQGEKQLYVHRVRTLLSTRPELRDKYVFVLNKADYDKLQQEEGFAPQQLGDAPGRVTPEYALTGTFYVNTNATHNRRSDAYLCTFRLTKLDTGVQLWEGSYETAKHIKKDLLD